MKLMPAPIRHVLWCCAAAPAVLATSASPSSLSLVADGNVAILGGLRGWGTVAAAVVEPADSENRSAVATTDASTEAERVLADVCAETLRLIEKGVRSKEDLPRLNGTIAPVCEALFRQRADASTGPAEGSALTASAAREWCATLDGRLVLALGTSIVLAGGPTEAKAVNPYANESRREFCDDLATSVRSAAGAGGERGGSSTAAAAPRPPRAGESSPSAPATAAVAAVPTKSSANTTAPVAASVVSSKSGATTAAGVASAGRSGSTVAPQGSGVNMLQLLQELSGDGKNWGMVCGELVTGLSAVEGSVTDQEVLGATATGRNAAGVLTFNAPDQQRLGRCAAQLKMLALDKGMFRTQRTTSASPPYATPAATALRVPGGPGKKLSTLAMAGAAGRGAGQLGAAAELDATESTAFEALVASPWARDACADLAHGYLTARLVDPHTTAPQFCERYAQDVRGMRATDVDPVTAKRRQATEDLRRLRRRGATNSWRTAAKASTATKGSEAAQGSAHWVVALAARGVHTTTGVRAPTPQTVEAEDVSAGAAFWRGTLA